MKVAIRGPRLGGAGRWPGEGLSRRTFVVALGTTAVMGGRRRKGQVKRHGGGGCVDPRTRDLYSEPCEASL